jgi:VCBS repeat-containing protein
VPANFAPSGGFGVLSAAVSSSDPRAVDWSFTVSDAALQALGAGQTITQTYRLSVTDGSLASAQTFLAVTLSGTNDAPTATGESLTGATEGAGFSIAAAALLGNDVDIDFGDVLRVVEVGGAAERNGRSHRGGATCSSPPPPTSAAAQASSTSCPTAGAPLQPPPR